ncbi:MAG: transcriptional regulator [Gallionella sp.]|nr:transcriptional regulator [Gallionella sp.]
MAQRINHGAIPDALKNFDTLPDAANVRDKVVAGLFGCSVPTVWRMAKDGRLPAPRKLSLRVTAWNCGELRAALSAAR